MKKESAYDLSAEEHISIGHNSLWLLICLYYKDPDLNLGLLDYFI